MNIKAVSYVLGKFMIVEAALMCLPLIVNIYYLENNFIAFIVPIAVLVLLGILLTVKKPKNLSMHENEGYIICGFAWIVLSLFGAIPFVISKTIPNYIDAFFETVSGFTTTGASILATVETLPRGIAFWRSFTNWIGGMGVLCFMMAIIPHGESHSMHIFKAESPGPKAGKVAAKMKDSARLLYSMYIILTLLEIIFLRLGGMRLFNSVCTTFATAGTGGFSTWDLSSRGFFSPYTEWVCAVFMILFGINFNIYFFILAKRFKRAFQDEELKAYLIIYLCSALAVTFSIAPMYSNLGYSFRTAFFQTASIMTTTGFASVDFNTWPNFAKVILVVLMFIGASAGSTGGGIKVSRLVIYIKEVYRDLKQLKRPRNVVCVRMDNRAVEPSVLRGANAFLIIYCLIFFASLIVVSADPAVDFETTFSAVAACFNNIGPGLGKVGPASNYESLSYFSKIVLSFDMLAGRLEIFPIILLFAPSTWKIKRLKTR